MASANQLQEEFLSSVANPFELRRLFELIPGILFFMKDTESRLMLANHGVLNRMGVQTEAEAIGTSDYDFFPREVADSFIEDDQRVLKTGQPLLIDGLAAANLQVRLIGMDGKTYAREETAFEPRVRIPTSGIPARGPPS